MGFDIATIAGLVEDQDRVARVLIRGVKGSAPRGAGTSMLVWKGGQSGSIGGGALEHRAIGAARDLLARAGDWQRSVTQIPLGPALGQCCGGSVSLLTEVFGFNEIKHLCALAKKADTFSRPLLCGALPVASMRGSPLNIGDRVEETFGAPMQPLWIYGAGHVGRALVNILADLEFDLTWVDTDLARFPANMPDRVAPLVAAHPWDAVAHAPQNAMHLVMTYSHMFDLEICHAILGHSFQTAGLIGSATKWARFRKRLLALGHTPGQIARIDCPIGQPDLGKSPVAIAVGVAAELLKAGTAPLASSQTSKEFAS